MRFNNCLQLMSVGYTVLVSRLNECLCRATQRSPSCMNVSDWVSSLQRLRGEGLNRYPLHPFKKKKNKNVTRPCLSKKILSTKFVPQNTRYLKFIHNPSKIKCLKSSLAKLQVCQNKKTTRKFQVALISRNSPYLVACLVESFMAMLWSPYTPKKEN